ncbi:MAG TPA: hypothetical protein VIJ95_01045 [Hanamia sp.]
MFKLPNGIPSLRTSAQEWADFAEYKSLKMGKVSLLDIIKSPLIVSDELIINGIEDDTDKFNNKIDEIAAEIKNRSSITRNQYPFGLEDIGYTLKYIQDENLSNLIYRFLLLATRLSMKDEKIQGGIDGTKLFEKLSAEIAVSFFGENSNVDILGTSKADRISFRSKLTEITKRIGEGGKIHEHSAYRPQDDNIDVIAWKGFSDKKVSQVIAFGQCKTGTSWQDRLSELNANAFCNTWFSEQPVLMPIRMFFCAQYFPNEIWRPRANEAGLVFDRFRIIDYLPAKIEDSLLKDIRLWCAAVENLYYKKE